MPVLDVDACDPVVYLQLHKHEHKINILRTL